MEIYENRMKINIGIEDKEYYKQVYKYEIIDDHRRYKL